MGRDTIVTCDQCGTVLGGGLVLDVYVEGGGLAHAGPGSALTFCGWPCLAEYATARALLESASEG